MPSHAPLPRDGGILLRDAIVSFVALLIVFAAFDDITTDNATHFTAEYTALMACAAWFGVVAVQLARRGHPALGLVSLGAVAGAVWAQRGIVPGITAGPWPEYIVMTGAFLWMLALAATLAVLGCRAVWRPATSSQ